MIVMVLAGMLAMEFAMAIVEPVDPVVMRPPMPGNPDVFITRVPVARTVNVKRAIAFLDHDPERLGAGCGEQANRRQNRQKNRKFSFHNYSITCSL